MKDSRYGHGGRDKPTVVITPCCICGDLPMRAVGRQGFCKKHVGDAFTAKAIAHNKASKFWELRRELMSKSSQNDYRLSGGVDWKDDKGGR